MVTTKVIIMNGYSGSGKTLTENIACRLSDRASAYEQKQIRCNVCSSVGHIKYSLNELGINTDDPDDYVRNIIHQISKAEGIKRFYPFLTKLMNGCFGYRSHAGLDVWFIDVREPEWIEWLKYTCEALGFDVYTVWVDRAASEEKANKNPATPSDGLRAKNYEYDYFVNNNIEGNMKKVIRNLEYQVASLFYDIGVTDGMSWFSRYCMESVSN